jgi:hypothetical protein
MYSILPEDTVHMYLDNTGRGLDFKKITGCMGMYVCVSMWECERQGVQQTVSKNLYAK